MPKKAALTFTLLALTACFLSYKLGSAPVVLAKAHPAPQDAAIAPPPLPAPPATWVLTAQGDPFAASVTIAAGAGVQHVVTGLSASLTTQSTLGCEASLYLRNGPSGTGPIIMRWNLAAPAAPGNTSSTDSPMMNLTGISVVGSANTAMTFEFNGNCGSGNFQTVNMMGYDAS